MVDYLADIRMSERQAEVLRQMPICGWDLEDACNAAEYALGLEVGAIQPRQMERSVGWR